MSAAQPLYIDPYVDEKNARTFISGDHNAQSPALFAFYFAMQAGKDPEKINVVSIGSFYKRSSPVSSSTPLVDWLKKLMTLRTDNKAHSMDYMLTHILEKYKNRFYKFDYPVSSATYKSIQDSGSSRKKTLT